MVRRDGQGRQACIHKVRPFVQGFSVPTIHVLQSDDWPHYHGPQNIWGEGCGHRILVARNVLYINILSLNSNVNLVGCMGGCI